GAAHSALVQRILDPGERFVVAATFEEVRQSRIHLGGQAMLERRNGLRNMLQPRKLAGGGTIPPSRVANHRQPLPPRIGELIIDRGWIHSRKIACSRECLQLLQSWPDFASRSAA